MIKKSSSFFIYKGGGRDDLDQYSSSKEVKMKGEENENKSIKKIRFSNHFSTNDVFQCIGKFKNR